MRIIDWSSDVCSSDLLGRAIDHAAAAHPGLPLLAMTPRGAPMTQARVRALATGPGAIILCGRFEGFDERTFDARPSEQLSMGDIILSGGEKRTEEQTTELPSLNRISNADVWRKKRTNKNN